MSETKALATVGPWRYSQGTEGIITDDLRFGGPPSEDEKEWYGGFLVCESITSRNRDLVLLCVNTILNIADGRGLTPQQVVAGIRAGFDDRAELGRVLDALQLAHGQIEALRGLATPNTLAYVDAMNEDHLRQMADEAIDRQVRHG